MSQSDKPVWQCDFSKVASVSCLLDLALSIRRCAGYYCRCMRCNEEARDHFLKATDLANTQVDIQMAVLEAAMAILDSTEGSNDENKISSAVTLLRKHNIYTVSEGSNSIPRDKWVSLYFMTFVFMIWIGKTASVLKVQRYTYISWRMEIAFHKYISGPPKSFFIKEFAILVKDSVCRIQGKMDSIVPQDLSHKRGYAWMSDIVQCPLAVVYQFWNWASKLAFYQNNLNVANAVGISSVKSSHYCWTIYSYQ